MASYVVDTNFLRNDRLAQFLSESTSNTIAIAEYTCMECYQGDALVNMERSLRHVIRFPNQVTVLRWAGALVRDQDALGRELSRTDLVEQEQTTHFPEFCRAVRAALSGDRTIIRQILDHGDAAVEQLTVLRDGAVHVADGITAFAADMDSSRLKRIRKGEPFTAEDIDWFLHQVVLMAQVLHEDHPAAPSWPDFDQLRGGWLFRYALAGCLLMRRWIHDGGIESVPTRKLANDVIDMTISTYGTYFDGVLTLDRKLGEIHEEMRWVLQHGFGVALGE